MFNRSSKSEFAKQISQVSPATLWERGITMDYVYMISDNKMIITLNADLDHHLADEIRNVVDDVIDKRGVRDIIFDFSKISFMDSAGIGLIMGRYKKIRDVGKIAVVGVNASIDRILQISGLHKIVEISTDTVQAVKKMQGDN